MFQTDIPIVIKGVQTAEDALMAVKAGAAGVVLSNHGGRNCDTSRSGIEGARVCLRVCLRGSDGGRG